MCLNIRMISRNDACWCGSGKKWKKCHWPQKGAASPDHSVAHAYKEQYDIYVKTPKQIEGIRNACQLAATFLQQACAMAQEGVTTNAIDQFVRKLHTEAGAVPAPLGYGDPPFPKAICTSLNEVICHGIPNDIPLQAGDIVNIDITCILDGYYGDCSAMVQIGEVSAAKQLVCDVSHACLMQSIAILRPGVLIQEIGDVIEAHAQKHHCSVVNAFVGHGVGLFFHEAPQIPHHHNDVTIPLVEGMTFTIEPMINGGVRDAIVDPTDQWTARTADGQPSAQWEHTLLITQQGCEILTTA